jgi:hypothetical protein
MIAEKIRDTRSSALPSELSGKLSRIGMKTTQRVKEAGAMGYILLWLLGIPIPVLLLFFLLRGCT